VLLLGLFLLRRRLGFCILLRLVPTARVAFDVFSHVAIPSVTNDAASDKAADTEAAGGKKDDEEAGGKKDDEEAGGKKDDEEAGGKKDRLTKKLAQLVHHICAFALP
jgi:hypothetical protein